jgi:hypothetical protein
MSWRLRRFCRVFSLVDAASGRHGLWSSRIQPAARDGCGWADCDPRPTAVSGPIRAIHACPGKTRHVSPRRGSNSGTGICGKSCCGAEEDAEEPRGTDSPPARTTD